MSVEDFEGFKLRADEVRDENARRRVHAAAVIKLLVPKLAGCGVTVSLFSKLHYRFETKSHVMDYYPGNQHILHPKNHRKRPFPYLRLPESYDIEEVVEALAKLIKKNPDLSK